MICAASNGARDFRVESRAEGRKRREDGADARPGPHNRESVPWARVRRPWHSLPRRSRIRGRYGIFGSAGMRSRMVGKELVAPLVAPVKKTRAALCRSVPQPAGSC